VPSCGLLPRLARACGSSRSLRGWRRRRNLISLSRADAPRFRVISSVRRCPVTKSPVFWLRARGSGQWQLSSGIEPVQTTLTQDAGCVRGGAAWPGHRVYPQHTRQAKSGAAIGGKGAGVEARLRWLHLLCTRGLHTVQFTELAVRSGTMKLWVGAVPSFAHSGSGNHGMPIYHVPAGAPRLAKCSRCWLAASVRYQLTELDLSRCYPTSPAIR